MQIDFTGPILNEKRKEILFLVAIDRYSKYPTVEIVKIASGPNVYEFLTTYTYTHTFIYIYIYINLYIYIYIYIY